MRCRPRNNEAPLLQLIKKFYRHPEKTNNALVMKLIVASKLLPAVLCNLNVNDVFHEAIVRQYCIKNWANRVVLQFQNGKVLNRPNGVSV